MIHYGMTKTAQVAVARGLAESVAGPESRVNSILVGPTASEGVGDFCHESIGQAAGHHESRNRKAVFFNRSPPLRS